MPDAVKFSGKTIPGFCLPFLPPPPEFEAVRTKFFNVRGESEIVGEIGGRTFEVPICLFGKYKDAADLTDFIESTLRELIGDNGTLELKDDSGWGSFLDCTFEGFTPQPPGVLHDDAGTLDGGWWCNGLLRFRKLSSK